MRKKALVILSFLLLIALFFIFQKRKAENNIKEVIELKTDTLASTANFKALVEDVLKHDLKKDDKSVILNIKISNTIWSYGLNQEEPYKSFDEKFREYLGKNFKSFDSEVSIGMSLYSKKYNLLIGGPKFMSKGLLVLADKEEIKAKVLGN